jgi:hypothetical protein
MVGESRLEEALEEQKHVPRQYDDAFKAISTIIRRGKKRSLVFGLTFLLSKIWQSIISRCVSFEKNAFILSVCFL